MAVTFKAPGNHLLILTSITSWGECPSKEAELFSFRAAFTSKRKCSHIKFRKLWAVSPHPEAVGGVEAMPGQDYLRGFPPDHGSPWHLPSLGSQVKLNCRSKTHAGPSLLNVPRKRALKAK